MKISSRHILKSAEVYGAEATVYTGSNSEPEDFLRFTVGGEWNPGDNAGSTYGKGLYSVYNLDGTRTSRGGYGRWIYKLRVNLYGFISFNEDITQKIYGSKLKPSQQYRMVYGENKLILPLLEELEKNNVGSYTSVIAESASKFLRGIVKGILFTGGSDGDVAVIYDANVVTPISYRHLDGDGEWKKFEKEKVKESIGRGMTGSFEPKKYNEGEDEADGISRIFVNHLNSLSGDESKLDNKSLRYVYYLIKNNPIEFLYYFSEKPWAETHLGVAAEVYAKQSPFGFLKNFSEKPWAEPYIGIAAKAYIEENLHFFLIRFSEKTWAKEARPELNGKSYVDIAAKAYAEQNPRDFLYYFSEKPWAEPYRNGAAEASARKNPIYFLKNFSERPWAKPYRNDAAKAYAEQNPRDFLYYFSEKPWAKAKKSELGERSYLDLAEEALMDGTAKTEAEQNPFDFLNHFSEKSWAKEARPELKGKSYVDIAAKIYAEQNPEYFLYKFSEKEWAKEERSELKGKSYLDLAREALNEEDLNQTDSYADLTREALNEEDLNQTASQVNVKLLKLAGALQNLRSEGLSKEISQIKDLARTRY